MSSVQVKVEPGESKSASTLIEEMKLLEELQGQSGTRKAIHSELWHACAGPLVSLPQPGSLVYYFPQGHSEQVTATTRRTANAHIPSYPDLPSQMMCQIHNVTLHDDKDTDEIYAQMTLQPVNSENDVFPIPDFGLTKSKQPSEFFCKTLTASDTSTHGGFSVPRRAAERLFPQLDYSMQPPNQELAVRDLHDNSWTFRHIYRGQPKRHLLTTGWSVFVGAKRLKAGDSVLFIRDEKSQLMLGVRRANRQQTVLPSSVLSSDSMHIGVLAAAAHAAVNRSQFTIYYNPRACPSEFVIPLAKYHKAAYGTQVSIGMRFGMMFETEDSSKRRYMGTIVGISDFDPSRWPNSKWRNLQVEWDEHGCIERPDRVSFWEIETPESLFIYPSPTSSLKRAYSGSADADAELDNFMRRLFSRPPENRCGSTLYPIFPGLCSDDLMKSLKPQSMNTSFQVGCHQSIYSSMLQSLRNHEFTIASTITPAYLKRGTQLQKETACQGGKEQSHNISVHQEKLPLQNIMGENHNARLDCLKKQQLDDSDLDSQTHVPLEEINSEPLEELNVKCRNELIERKSGTWSIPNDNATRFDAMKPDKSSMPVKDKPENSQIAIMQPDQQLHAEQSIQGSGRCHGEGLAASLNPETLARRSVLNQGPDMMLDGGFQVLQSPQFETGVAQPTQLDTMSSDMFELNPLPDQSDQVSTHYMDILGWMLQPPSCQSFTRELKLPESLLRFGKTDPLICGSSHTASGSADIADVVNQENFIPVRKDQFPIPPGANTSQSPPTLAQEMLGTHLPNSTRDLPPLDEQSTSHHAFQALSSEVHDFAVQKEVAALRSFSSCYKLKDFSDESNNPNEIHSSLQFDCNGSMITDPAISCSTQEGFGTARNSSLTAPSKGMIYKFNSCHDVQSQVTSASLTDFSLQEFPDNSGGTSSSNIDGENSLLNNGSWKQVSPLRTYTKVQKLGSVGRSIDVTRFKNYSELKSAIACMFGLEGQLDDPRGSGWKLVYIDYENDILLVGDDPWEEFICCVRCIRILSPSEVQQMSHEGVQFTNNPFAYHVEQSQFLDCGQELPEL